DSRLRGNDSVGRGNDSVGRGNDSVGRGNDKKKGAGMKKCHPREFYLSSPRRRGSREYNPSRFLDCDKMTQELDLV
ncbi:MAG: hypothetical protein SFT93_00240, partial [Rickettsiaceae bacterium]|nr:hypothetical protein [Rickettsiaceae bacterium]